MEVALQVKLYAIEDLCGCDVVNLDAAEVTFVEKHLQTTEV